MMRIMMTMTLTPTIIPIHPRFTCDAYQFRSEWLIKNTTLQQQDQKSEEKKGWGKKAQGRKGTEFKKDCVKKGAE